MKLYTLTHAGYQL